MVISCSEVHIANSCETCDSNSPAVNETEVCAQYYNCFSSVNTFARFETHAFPWAQRLLTSLRYSASLCVSAGKCVRSHINHRVAENAEITQRRISN